MTSHMMLRPGSAFLSLLLLTSIAHAEDKRGQYEVLGVGNRTCKQYLVVRNPNPYDELYGDPLNHHANTPGANDMPDQEYLSWMYGYVTSFNKWVLDTYSVRSGISIEDMRKWLVQYCLANPQLKFQEAVEAFVDLHFAKRTSSAPDNEAATRQPAQR